MALFIVARREKKSIFLEPNGGDQVQTVVDTIAGLMRKSPDDVALSFEGKRLDNDKTFADCGISHKGNAIVEPITVYYIYKKEGTDDEWEEPGAEEYSDPPGSEKADMQEDAAPEQPPQN